MPSLRGTQQKDSKKFNVKLLAFSNSNVLSNPE